MSKISVTLAKPVEVKRDAFGQAAPVSLRRAGRRQEYEEYESKKRKRDAHDDGENARQQGSPTEQVTQDPTIQTDPPDAARGEVASADSAQAGAPNVQGSDSDWLRGKTSRLLDLVEEDTLNPDAFPTSATAIINQTTQTSQTSYVDNEEDIKNPTRDEGSDGTMAVSIPNARLFVRNLPFNTSQDSLRTTFSPYGRISEVS
jgi:multiple RNA-binding domain-containing protein 1